MERKAKPGRVRCIDCKEFDILDMWCPRYARDVREPYEEIRCRGFVVIKEPRHISEVTQA